MPSRTQTNRRLAIATPLGDDALLLTAFHGSESLSRPFHYELELLSEAGSVDFDDILGKNVTIAYEEPVGTIRYFNGQISRFVETQSDGRTVRYAATVVPWLWFLTRMADCRIFQGKTVPEIVQQIFADHGFADFDTNLNATYDPWEYCVQYRETDFNFISRLLEHEGIYYFFKHEDGKHTLILADNLAAHSTATDYETIDYRPPDKASDGAFIRDWSIEQTVQPSAYVLTDFDFKAPKKPLLANATSPLPTAVSDHQIFDYPGDYTEKSQGETYAQTRLDEHLAQYTVITAHTDVPGLSTGNLFTLNNHPRDDQNKQYLLTSTTYQIHESAYDSTSAAAPVALFASSFTCIDSTLHFRPPRITPSPIIQGPQTAIVVGTKGEEIYTDPFGRVKVMFHWDRNCPADETSSCFIRVAQVWAGKKWGGMFIPRIGQEVIVEFLEGDPDQPIITGRVYNGDTKPPYDLPANQTMSTVKSNSSKGSAGFNEIRFEDKKGSEHLFFHAEKDLEIRVKNDRHETIIRDHNLTVGRDKVEHIKNKRSETVDSDHMESITGDRNLNVGGKEAKGVTGSLSLSVTGAVVEVFKADHSEQTTGDYYLKANNVIIEALTNVTIKVGSSYIAIEASGITIGTTGTLDLVSTGKLSATSSADLALQATGQGTFKAGGPITIQGAVVNVNT